MSCPLYIDQSFEENWRNPPEEDGELGDPARFLELASPPTSPLAEGPPKSPNSKNKKTFNPTYFKNSSIQKFNINLHQIIISLIFSTTTQIKPT